jgi:hypothetical protein
VVASTCVGMIEWQRSSCVLPSKAGCDRFREGSSPVNLARAPDLQRGLNRVFVLCRVRRVVARSRLLRRLRTGSLTRTRERAELIGNRPTYLAPDRDLLLCRIAGDPCSHAYSLARMSNHLAVGEVAVPVNNRPWTQYQLQDS